MARSLSRIVRNLGRLLVPAPLRRRLRARRAARELEHWKRNGRPLPPPHEYKRETLLEYGQRFGAKILVETGTYRGAMVDAMREAFTRVFSIELDETLWRKAVQRFKRYPHITILRGDSADMLPVALQDIREPALFWLDGHYSGGDTALGRAHTPIKRELEHIFGRGGEEHVILIDDARCFTGEDDYPAIAELEALVRKHRPGWVVEVRDDIIRAHRP